MIKALILIAFLTLMITITPLYAADCPPNVDPVYCRGAEATGGKIYSGTPAENLKNIEHDMIADADQNIVHHDTIISFSFEDLFWLPAFLPLITLAVNRRIIKPAKIFASVYAFGNALPAVILLLHFSADEGAYGLSQIFFASACLIAVLTALLGYYKRQETISLYVASILSSFLAYLPLLILFSVNIS